MNQYTKAVNFIADYLDATDAVYREGSLPNIESGLEYAMIILRNQKEYDGNRPTPQ